jgi:hypothetical protein
VLAPPGKLRLLGLPALASRAFVFFHLLSGNPECHIVTPL